MWMFYLDFRFLVLRFIGFSNTFASAGCGSSRSSVGFLFKDLIRCWKVRGCLSSPHCNMSSKTVSSKLGSEFSAISCFTFMLSNEKGKNHKVTIRRSKNENWKNGFGGFGFRTLKLDQASSLKPQASNFQAEASNLEHAINECWLVLASWFFLDEKMNLMFCCYLSAFRWAGGYDFWKTDFPLVVSISGGPYIFWETAGLEKACKN